MRIRHMVAASGTEILSQRENALSRWDSEGGAGPLGPQQLASFCLHDLKSSQQKDLLSLSSEK